VNGAAVNARAVDLLSADRAHAQTHMHVRATLPTSISVDQAGRSKEGSVVQSEFLVTGDWRSQT
jgi:hypothetical protein